MTLGQKQIEQIKFSQEPGNIHLAVGSVKSGKSFGAGLALPLHTLQDPEPRNNLVLGRKLSVMEKALIPSMKIGADMAGAGFSYNRSSGEASIGHHTYSFVACNDVKSEDKLRGIPNVHSVLIDEVTLTLEPFVEMALSRLERPDSKAWLTCNPTHPLNFVKKKWLDKGRIDKHQVFFLRDNPYLDEATIRRQEEMFTGVFHKRMIDAVWAAGEGVIMAGYQFSEPPDPNDVVRTDIGFDYGTSTPSAIVVLQTLKGGSYYVPYSFKVEVPESGVGLTDNELLQILLPIVERWGARTVVHDPVAASFRAELLKHPNRSYRVRRALTAKTQGTNPQLYGIRKLQNCLARGIVKLAPEQQDLEEELMSYIWDPEKEDSPLKINDHLIDAMRFVTTDRVREAYGPIDLPEGM